MERIFALVLCGACAVAAMGQEAAIAPKYFGPAAGDVVKGEGAVAEAEGDAFTLACEPSGNGYPGICVKPKEGKAWDFGAFGHIEATVSNACDVAFGLAIRVDNPTHWEHSNTEQTYLKPGEQRVLKVIFGYQYGHKKGFDLDAGNISQVKIFFAGKNDKAARKAVLKGLCAAGAKGEKPLASPGSIVVVPKDGVLLPAKGLTAENFNCWVGSSATPKKDGTVKVAFSEKAGCAVRYKLPAGVWNLGDWLKVEATVRNTSDRAIVPVVKVDSKGGAAAMEGETVLKPKETKTIEVVFIPKVPWEAGEDNKTKPGTEWKFESHRVTGILFQVKDNKAGDSYEVLNVTAKKVIAKKPKWLGKHPPVKGDWTLTLNENFDGKAIDANVWTNGWDNYWDQRTHFSKDNLFLRDGCMVLKYEKKRGHHLDDENGKVTDYQCGYAATYGRFTQKYGYFEARMKLPEAPGLWPAFWTMPDRGGSGPHWIRSDTWKGGMEFDIMEHLTAWGPHRFNMAFHWDGYDKFHKSIGTSGAYVPADEEGFMTIGMLWLPGEVVYFGNGRPIGVWKSPRVSDVPAYLIFYMVSGGWANVPIEDDKLPAEFIVDYVRVWQRKDLAK